MYDPVIFDLDGTLLNTIGDLAEAGNHTLLELGYPVHDIQEYKIFVGNGIPKLVERFLPKGFSEETFNTAYKIFGEYYGEHFADRTVPYDGITELVKELRNKGVNCLCNTNKSHKYAAKLIEKFFGSDIRETVGGENGYPRKPSPEAALYLGEKYKKAGFKPLFAGDSSVDMQTAQNAGFDACGVLWGFRASEELESFKPRFIVKDVNELRRAIVGS